MAKINITKPTGVENLNLISAFKADNNIYVILDSEKMGSMGLPIIYVSKYTQKLEKIADDNEWQSVKNFLKGIINGTNFEYVKLGDNLTALEAYYTPLTLPQASFDLIKSRYVVKEEVSSIAPTLEPTTVTVSDLINEMTIVQPKVMEEVNIAPSTPIMPNNNVGSNAEINSTMVNTSQVAPMPEVAPVQVSPMPGIEPVKESVPVANKKFDNNFENDKETFLKACENMFDALVSKYQKRLDELEQREQIMLKKEQEIEEKLKNANEHLANAEAREQVANIAHDNAQRVMDISNFMPNNPNGNSTGVI